MRESGPCGQSRNMSSINLSQRLGLQSLKIKEFLLKVAHEQIGIGGSHTGAHGRAFNLEVMMGVGEVVVGEDKLGESDKELSGW